MPTLNSSDTNCASDLQTYSTTINIQGADGIVVNEGTVTDNGNGDFVIDGITAGTDLIITATNSTTTCSDQFTITTPDCSCPAINAPISGGDMEICEGDAIPTLTASAGANETIDCMMLISEEICYSRMLPALHPVMEEPSLQKHGISRVDV